MIKYFKKIIRMCQLRKRLRFQIACAHIAFGEPILYFTITEVAELINKNYSYSYTNREINEAIEKEFGVEYENIRLDEIWPIRGTFRCVRAYKFCGKVTP